MPFEVGCARCGHDLRGLNEPLCPACGLQFDWAEAVPVESLVCRKCKYHLYGLRDTRCPECGEPFTWEQALDDYRRSRKPLFEYRWREEPVRSLVRTWRMALRPRKLWSAIDLHDPPKVFPLTALVVIALGVMVVALAAPAVYHEAFYYLQWTGQLRRQGRATSQFSFGLWDVLNSALTSRAVWRSVGMVGTWWGWSLAALMIFQQSMRRGRVRIVHVFRACVFSVVPLAPVVAMLMVPLEILEFEVARRYFRLTFLDYAMPATVVLLLGCALYALTAAYRRYLKMPHAFGVALASQVIALLATIATCSLIFLYL